MKKLIIMFFMLIPLCTGCSNIDANIDFLDTKNVMFSANVNSKDKITPEEAKLIKDNYKNYIDDDFITDVYFSDEEAKIQAVKISKNIKRNDINLSSTGLKTNNKDGRFIEIKHNPFVTLYKVDLEYNLDAQAEKFKKKNLEKPKDTAALKPEYLQKYGDEEIMLDNPEQTEEEDFQANFEENSISERETTNTQTNTNEDNSNNENSDLNISDLNLTFTITLPSRASFSNADKVEENIYYWNIKSGEPASIKLQYIVYNSWAILLLLLFVFGILYLLARKILKHDEQKRIGTNN